MSAVRSNFAWAVVGNGLYGLCQWATIAVLARLGSPELVGQFALAFAITAPIFLFTDLNLRSLQATDAEGRYALGDYLGLRLGAIVVALAVVAAIALLFGLSREKSFVLLAVAASKSVESVAEVLYGFLQKHERMRRIALSMIVKGIVSIVALAVVLGLTGSLVAGLLALTAGWLAALLTIDVGAVRAIDGAALMPRLDLATLSRLAWLALPLGLNRLLGSLEANAPRYLIELRLGEASLGIFAVMAWLVLIGNRVVHAMAQATSQRLARFLRNGEWAAARRVLGIWLALGIALAAGATGIAAAFGGPLLGLLYGAEYAAEERAFVWIMGAGGLGFMGIFFDYALTVLRRLRIQALIRALSLITILSACLLWITESGLLGVGRALVAGATVQLLLAAGATAYGWRGARAET